MTPIRQGSALRTVWLSDLHLGSRACRAADLLEFLRRVECETLYLLGDIVDFHALRQRLHWPAAHQDVVRMILHKARRGTRVVYIPGNHDEVLREFIGRFDAVEIQREASHVTADGRRLLLLHGDDLNTHAQLDRFSRLVGDTAYDFLLWLHRGVCFGRRLLGLPHWSLANAMKVRLKSAREAIAVFRQAAIDEARRRRFDGVVCGHIHHPAIERQLDVLYCNTGDWVENCSALTENAAGELALLRWPDLCGAVDAHGGNTAAAIPLTRA